MSKVIFISCVNMEAVGPFDTFNGALGDFMEVVAFDRINFFLLDIVQIQQPDQEADNPNGRESISGLKELDKPIHLKPVMVMCGG